MILVISKSLDNNGGDGLLGTEEGVGAAGVLLREFAHNLERLIRCIRSGSSSLNSTVHLRPLGMGEGQKGLAVVEAIDIIAGQQPTDPASRIGRG